MITKKIKKQLLNLKKWDFCTEKGLVYKVDEIYLIDNKFITKDTKEPIYKINIKK